MGLIGEREEKEREGGRHKEMDKLTNSPPPDSNESPNIKIWNVK